MVLSKIIGVGKYLPEKVLTNADLEKMVDTSDEWIKDRSGISERRIAGNKEPSSYMGSEAVKRACDNAKISYDDIDFVICTTNSPDMLFPATAMQILQNMGIKDRPGMDLQAGCTSFCYGLEIADSLIKGSNRYKKIAVVGAEKLSRLVDWEDRNTCVLFGDGSGAVIVSKNEESGLSSIENCEAGIISSYLGGDSSKTNAIRLEAGLSQNPATIDTVRDKRHFFKMEGQDVFKFAVKVIPDCIRKLLTQANMVIDQIKLIIPHQANIRIVEAAAKFLKVSIDKFYMNIHKYGNTSAASVPIALEEAINEGRIKKGDTIITVGFGAGLTYAANIIRF